jgi:hypothetical protein
MLCPGRTCWGVISAAAGPLGTLPPERVDRSTAARMDHPAAPASLGSDRPLELTLGYNVITSGWLALDATALTVEGFRGS